MDVLHSSRPAGAPTPPPPPPRHKLLLPDANDELLQLLPRHLLLSPTVRADDQQQPQPISTPAALIGDSAHNAAQGAPAAPLAEVAKRSLERFMTHTQALAAAPPPPSIAPLRVNMPASGAAARLAALGQPFADAAAAAAAPWPIPAAAGTAAARACAPPPPSSRGGGVMHAAAAPPPAPAGSNMLALATWQWAEAVAALAQQHQHQQQPCFGAAGQVNSFMAADDSPTMINVHAAALMAMHPPPSAPRPALPPPAQPATSRHLWLGNVMVADADALARVFSPFGALESVRAFSGRTYAFVNFERACDAAAAKAGLEMAVLPELTGAAPLLVRFQLPEAALYPRAAGA